MRRYSSVRLPCPLLSAFAAIRVPHRVPRAHTKPARSQSTTVNSGVNSDNNSVPITIAPETVYSTAVQPWQRLRNQCEHGDFREERARLAHYL